MKLVLHIGTPKTGTTSIQKTLRNSTEYLDTLGILYPQCPFHKNRHVILGLYAGVTRRSKLISKEKIDNLEDIRNEWFANLRRQVQEEKPKAIVFSAEELFMLRNVEQAFPLKRQIDSLSPEELAVVAYIRKPSSDYLSSTQQYIKASSTVPTARPRQLRSVLSTYEQAFGRSNIYPSVFDRSLLYQGDVVSDFVEKHLKGTGIDRSKLSDVRDANATLSAEAIYLLRTYREKFHSSRENIFTSDSRELIRELAEIDKILKIKKPRIEKEIGDYLDYVSADVIWLRETYQLTFPGYDYDAFEEKHNLASQIDPPSPRLEDVFILNTDLVRKIAQTLSDRGRAKRWNPFQDTKRFWQKSKGPTNAQRQAWLAVFCKEDYQVGS